MVYVHLDDIITRRVLYLTCGKSVTLEEDSYFELTTLAKLISMALRSNAWFAAARLLGSRVRIPLYVWMFSCCASCVCRGLCDGPITRLGESY
jgi:hypothetical protein